jgi:hypothetical protein
MDYRLEAEQSLAICDIEAHIEDFEDMANIDEIITSQSHADRLSELGSRLLSLSNKIAGYKSE